MAKKLAHISEDHSREQTVYEHLTGTAELAKQFAAAFGAEEDGYLLGLLHDIGKYSDAFQRRLDGGMRVDHSTAGAKEACAHGVGYLALAIAGHHGGMPNFGSRADTKNDATLSGRLKRDLEPYGDWKTEVTLPPVKPFNMREFNTGFRLSFYIRMLFSCLVDADFIDTETFMDGALAPRGNYDALLRCSTAWKRTSHRGIRPKPSSTESAAPFWMRARPPAAPPHRVFIRLPCRRVAEKRPLPWHLR